MFGLNLDIICGYSMARYVLQHETHKYAGLLVKEREMDCTKQMILDGIKLEVLIFGISQYLARECLTKTLNRRRNEVTEVALSNGLGSVNLKEDKIMFNLKDKVEVAPEFHNYAEWKDEKLIVVGLTLQKDDIITYTVRDDDGFEWDGMTDNDLKLR